MSYITVESGQLSTEQKEKIIALYIDGFGDRISFIKGRDKQKEFLSDTVFIDFSTMYVALYESEVVGFMGVSDNKKRCISFGDVEKFEKMFGTYKGRAIQKKLSTLRGKPAVDGDRDLYIEYLVTDENYRCKGVASKLIHFAFEQLECEEYYIDVFSKNINAKRLYESLGFVEWKRDCNPIMIMLGVGHPIKLKKRKN